MMAEFEYMIKSEADATLQTGPKPPLDFSYHFSRVTAARVGSNVKEFYKYFRIPGIENLAGGKFWSYFYLSIEGFHLWMSPLQVEIDD
jgi:hypothetical protein